jgi:hypothetical protein
MIQQRPLVYLACPYSHDDPKIREERFLIANREAGKLMKAGHMVFSPISHSHPIALAGDLPKTWEYWENFCRTYMSYSYLLVVLCIDGWEESTGIRVEIEIAKEMGMGIKYMTMEEMT